MSRARDTADQINRVNSSAADATAITVDSSENVLVGKTSSSTTTAGNELRAGGLAAFTRSGSYSLNLNRLASDGDIAVFQKDNTTVGSIQSRGGTVSTLILDPRTNGGGLTGTANAVMPTSNAGVIGDANTSLDLGASGYAFRNAYLSGGVYLGGTGSANKLDDYEEGTWSPFWCNSAGQAIFTVNPNVNMARYTKIGKQVTVSCYFNMPSTFSTSGNYSASAGLQIGGLPFGANGNGGVNDYYAGSVGWYASFSSSYNSVSSKTPMVYTRTNSNQIELGHADGVGHASTLQEHANNANSGILLTISYLTNS